MFPGAALTVSDNELNEPFCLLDIKWSFFLGTEHFVIKLFSCKVPSFTCQQLRNTEKQYREVFDLS